VLSFLNSCCIIKAEFINSPGELNLEANAHFEEDTAAMLDSLQELFQERGDKVTAKLIADRMERKLHRHIHYHRAAYLYRLMGFNAIRGNRYSDNSKYYVVPDLELLAEKRTQFCKLSEDKN
jgi:hypothetical protein